MSAASGPWWRRLSPMTLVLPAMTAGPHARTASTRHLCAAAHVDEGFTKRALTMLLGERYRVAAPAQLEAMAAARR